MRLQWDWQRNYKFLLIFYHFLNIFIGLQSFSRLFESISVGCVVVYCKKARILEFKDFIFNSNAAALGAALMDNQKVQLFHGHLPIKEVTTGVPTPWH